MSTQVSEKEAREVGEAARETEWTLPSFSKELFLGNFRLDLIHPQPQLDAAAIEKGERFPRHAARVPRDRGGPAAHRARGEDPGRRRGRTQAHRRDGDEG